MKSIAKKRREAPEQAAIDLSVLRRALRAAYEERDYLAGLLGTVCKNGSNGRCKLFYQCPAPRYGLSCGEIDAGAWKQIAHWEATND